MTKTKAFTPKPLVLQALPNGSKNPSHAAHMIAINDAKKQMSYNNMMSGGDPSSLKPASIPQSPMYGMKPSLGDANDITVGSTNQRAQSHENASYDDMVGKVAKKGGAKKSKGNRKKSTKRSHKSKKSRRKTKIRRKTKKSRRKTKKSHRKR